MFGAAPTGDVPTTSELSASSFLISVHIIRGLKVVCVSNSYLAVLLALSRSNMSAIDYEQPATIFRCAEKCCAISWLMAGWVSLFSEWYFINPVLVIMLFFRTAIVASVMPFCVIKRLRTYWIWGDFFPLQHCKCELLQHCISTVGETGKYICGKMHVSNINGLVSQCSFCVALGWCMSVLLNSDCVPLYAVFGALYRWRKYIDCDSVSNNIQFITLTWINGSVLSENKQNDNDHQQSWCW